MSVFSEKLQELVAQTNSKITVLAKNSGVERSYIQKMLVGERIPAQRKLVEQLGKAMMLAPAQLRDFLDCYSISKMGEATYLRRRSVQTMLERMAELASPPPVVTPGIPGKISPHSPTLSIHGKNNIMRMMKTLIDQELSRKSASLRLIAQPGTEEILSSAFLPNNAGCPILEHIICLDNSVCGQQGNQYNISVLSAILPLLFSGADYRPLFYYDSMPSHINSMSLLPGVLLTSNAVLAFSCDFTIGLFLQDKEALSLYAGLFEQMRQNAAPVLHRLSGKRECPEGGLEAGGVSGRFYCLQDTPLLELFGEQNDAQKTEPVCPEDPQKILLRHARSAGLTSYFTAAGLKRFLTENILFPAAQEQPGIPLEKRRKMLARAISAAEEGFFRPVLLHSENLYVPQTLSVFCAGENQVLLSFRPAGDTPCSFLIEEQSLKQALYDFLEYLPESGLIYSVEESIACLQRAMDLE